MNQLLLAHSEALEVATRLVAAFSDGGFRAPQVIDRREAPSHGCSAVHVVVQVGRIPIEIQVRTRRQHEWAELFEKLADRLGRGIRYGEPPAHWRGPEEREQGPEVLRRLYDVSYRLREATVAWALAIASELRAVEQGASAGPRVTIS